MKNVSAMRAGNKKNWARARLIADTLKIPPMTARSMYSKLSTTVKDDTSFWNQLANRTPGSEAKLRDLTKHVGAIVSTPTQNGAKVTIPQEPIISKGENPETAFRKLVIDMGTVKARQIIDQVSEAALNGQ